MNKKCHLVNCIKALSGFFKYIQITVVFDDSLLGTGSLLKLFCDEHRNKAPLSSLVTVYVEVTFIRPVHFSVLLFVAFDV